jgi:TolB-like protein/Tfp pilus assembly protein PilF
MSDAAKAVFLSYASQDADAAQRIAEALRASGVEVWFDRSELVGGDAWDQKIRRQIKECALFAPVISANTQARTEGYFRLEWRLADQRTHLMAKGRPFLLPIVIDDTRDAEAHVPDSFTEVQWTRLPGGETPPAFRERVNTLLRNEDAVGAALRRDSSEESRPKAAATQKPSRRWLAPAIVAVVAIVAVALWQPWRTNPGLPPPGASARPDETAKWVAQARELIYDPDSARNEFSLAEGLLKRATELAPDSGAAWGASALLNHYFNSRGYDTNRQRLVRSQGEAEKALRLEPRNTDALLALGLHRQALGEKERAQDYLERARAADPQNFKAVLALSKQISDYVTRAKFLQDAATTISRPAELYYYSAVDLEAARRYDEAVVWSERAIQAQPFWRTFVNRANIEYFLTADPTKVAAWLDRVSELKRDEPRVAVTRFRVAMVRRDAAAALQALNAIAADYLDDNYFNGPKSFLLAQAYEVGGQTQRAAEQWEMAEKALREKHAAAPGDIDWRAMLSVALAGAGRAADAKQMADGCMAEGRFGRMGGAAENLAAAYVRLGEFPRAISLLKRIISGEIPWPYLTAATLRAEPEWDKLRGQPEFDALVATAQPATAKLQTQNAETSRPMADAKSVAVLPFENRSSEKDSEYFSDGISDELLNALGRVAGLRVVARTSSFTFKIGSASAQEIGRKLNVSHLVEGSVQRIGGKARVIASLVRADTGERLWSGRFDQELTDIFAAQDQVAAAIARALSLQLGASTRSIHRPVNPAAYELYARGRQAWNLRTMDGLARADALFNEAIAVDPNFAQAYVGLADVGELGKLFGPTARAAREEAQILAHIKRALELEPALAEAHASLGNLYSRDFTRFRDAEAAHRTAIKLNPNYASAHQWLARLLESDGRLEEALVSHRRAAELDPLSSRIADNFGRALLMAGRFSEACGVLDRAVTLQPDNTQARIWRAWALIQLGRKAEAVQEADRLAADETEPFGQTGASRVFYVAGLRDKGDAALAKSARREKSAHYLLTAFHRGDDIAVLFTGLEPTNVSMFYYLPEFEALRRDPRFQREIDRLGIRAAFERSQAELAKWKASAPR